MTKKLIGSSILAVAIGFSASVLAKEETGPGLGETDREHNQVAEVCTKDKSGSLILRGGPGKEYKKVSTISNGAKIVLDEGTYGEDGFYWWKITYKGKTGWVRADYVCGDPQ